MVLTGAAASAAGLFSGAASAADATAASLASPDLAAALARFRASIPADFDQTYVENAVVPFFLTSVYEGERPALPMIDVTLSKENALPHDMWGLIFPGWKPTPEEGVTVFLQGLEKRGDNNLRKRIYMSAVTPDLYHPVYGAKVVAFFDALLDPKFAGRPFMRHYLDYYWDIYWDLHLGVKGDAIPPQVRTIGESFNTVLAFRDPTQRIVYENYMTVRALLDFLRNWIDERLDDIENARIPNPERTIAWYWLKNAGDGAHFSKKDVVFECFHNFVAFSQWGNTIFGIMSRLSQDGGDPDVRAAFEKTMSGNPDATNGAPYTPLEMLVMEMFRTISPNGGSISSISDTRLSGSGDNYGDSVSPFVRFGLPFERNGYMISPHTSTSLRRFRAIRLRLSPLPRRAAHHPGVRGLPAQSLARQDNLPQFEPAEPASGADWSDRRHRRQYHVRPVVLIGEAATVNGLNTTDAAEVAFGRAQCGHDCSGGAYPYPTVLPLGSWSPNQWTVPKQMGKFPKSDTFLKYREEQAGSLSAIMIQR
jgi:hypothetical protein